MVDMTKKTTKLMKMVILSIVMFFVSSILLSILSNESKGLPVWLPVVFAVAIVVIAYWIPVERLPKRRWIALLVFVGGAAIALITSSNPGRVLATAGFAIAIPLVMVFVVVHRFRTFNPFRALFTS